MPIRWTPSAQRDLGNIIEYVTANGSAERARALAIRLFFAVTVLGRFPDSGRLGRVRGTRELVIGGTYYLAIYRVQPAGVEILRILHGAQRWP